MRTKSTVTRWFVAMTLAFAVSAPAGAGRVITIPPSHDPTGQTDYDALQTALLEVKPQTTVRLEAGTYYFNNALFADNFQGTLTGAGKDRTILTTVGTIEAWTSGDDPPWLNPPSLENPWPGLISFVDGNFTIRDMTFRITEPVPMIFEMFGTEFEVMAAVVYILGGDGPAPARSTIRRVGFEGASGTFGGYNVVQAIYHEGLIGETYEERGFPLTGRHVVSNCSFDTSYVGNSVYYLAEGASLLSKDNTFTNVTEGLEIYDSAGRIYFRGNDVAVNPSEWGGDGYGVLVLQGAFTFWDDLPPTPPMSLSVSDNEFRLLGGAVAAFDLEDWQFALVGTPPSLWVSVCRNEVVAADEATWGMYGYGLNFPRALWNDFRGTTHDAGVFVELTADGLFIMNDVRDLDAGTARFLLAEDTHDNLVVAENAWEDVLDLTDDPETQEYDGANRIVETGGW